MPHSSPQSVHVHKTQHTPATHGSAAAHLTLVVLGPRFTLVALQFIRLPSLTRARSVRRPVLACLAFAHELAVGVYCARHSLPDVAVADLLLSVWGLFVGHACVPGSSFPPSDHSRLHSPSDRPRWLPLSSRPWSARRLGLHRGPLPCVLAVGGCCAARCRALTISPSRILRSRTGNPFVGRVCVLCIRPARSRSTCASCFTPPRPVTVVSALARMRLHSPFPDVHPWSILSSPARHPFVGRAHTQGIGPACSRSSCIVLHVLCLCLARSLAYVCTHDARLHRCLRYTPPRSRHFACPYPPRLFSRWSITCCSLFSVP
ncbi:uncharacterized protein B0H18DRAFT_653267 [Fomitopsis serialis]|uniref:uncharacterized protein n=1 Tax=Fomitopsis serialis TaxID=139415 RepID=UPI0020083638|nr:uncharacterized protein B0H18DRAFT_653267 [Neoantrodia serialis]KAH9919267.1 hypothetical protein B0H18DRAFT_653267 [Neoantrodia serialis]